jgi:hypothetical protein
LPGFALQEPENPLMPLEIYGTMQTTAEGNTQWQTTYASKAWRDEPFADLDARVESFHYSRMLDERWLLLNRPTLPFFEELAAVEAATHPAAA